MATLCTLSAAGVLSRRLRLVRAAVTRKRVVLASPVAAGNKDLLLLLLLLETIEESCAFGEDIVGWLGCAS